MHQYQNTTSLPCKICFTTKESVKRKKDSGREKKGWSGGGEPQSSMLGNIKLGLLAWGQDPEGSIHRPALLLYKQSPTAISFSHNFQILNFMGQGALSRTVKGAENGKDLVLSLLMQANLESGLSENLCARSFLCALGGACPWLRGGDFVTVLQIVWVGSLHRQFSP
jgi:hypothetical protein